MVIRTAAGHPQKSRNSTTPPSEPVGNWILAAIDGTDSDEYFEGVTEKDCRVRGAAKHKSFTFRFYEDFKSESSRKQYWPGPSTLGVGRPGNDCNSKAANTISSDVYHWLAKIVKNTDIPIVVLVGHSRGGWIALDVAQKCQKDNIPVYFVGLYDAVDMTIFAEHAMIPNNIRTVFHAIRSEVVGSRRDTRAGRITNWKNAGIQSKKPTEFFAQRFQATHGNLGGSPPEPCNGSKPVSRWNLVSDKCRIDLSSFANHNAALAADAFIRNGARKYGLPLGRQGDTDVRAVQETLEQLILLKEQQQTY